MELLWHGHSCFELRAPEGVVVVDPHSGLKDAQIEADILAISHGHPGHSNVGAVAGEPFVIDGPGEYEIGGVFVVGVHVAHDARSGGDRGLTTAYCIAADGVTVCHLGDLARRPTQEQVEALGTADVLLVPVGGDHTLGPEVGGGGGQHVRAVAHRAHALPVGRRVRS